MSKQEQSNQSTSSEAEVMPTDLQVWTNDYDTYVARDKDHVRELVKKRTGYTPEGLAGDDNEMQNWYSHDPEKRIGMYWIERDVPEDAEIKEIEASEREHIDWDRKVIAPAKSWADYSGAGFLCSTEW